MISPPKRPEYKIEDIINPNIEIGRHWDFNLFDVPYWYSQNSYIAKLESSSKNYGL